MSSSIFNSEPLRNARALPLGLHLWHGVLALGFVATVVLVSLYTQRAKQDKAIDPYREMGTLRDAQVIILGDSQFRMLSVEGFGVPAQNRAMSGSDYEIHGALLENLLPQMPALKLAILELDVVPLYTIGVARRKGDFRDLCAYGIPWWREPGTTPLDGFSYWLHYNPILKPLLVGPKYELPDPYPVDAAARRKPEPEKPGPKPAPGFSVLPKAGITPRRPLVIDSMMDALSDP